MPTLVSAEDSARSLPGPQSPDTQSPQCPEGQLAPCLVDDGDLHTRLRRGPPPPEPGHGGLPGTSPAMVSGAGSGWHGACLPARAQGVCCGGPRGPSLRVLRAACVPALPDYLRGAPSLQHLPPFASHRARMEGAVFSPADASAPQDGRVTPARQMWMSAARRGVAVPSTASTRQAVTGAGLGRVTARWQTGHSAGPSRGPPGWPRTPLQEWTLRWGRKCRGCGRGWRCWSRSCSWCWPRCTAWHRGRWRVGSLTPAACWRTPSSSWNASTR
ncbi:epidermal growth factor-like protein 7 isoform X3 [Tamandua tetradactyla]|uniref:epidermal growth factor-like protein 7 isoform X3 n=1 Tax=Tamandua tetradactyla TaxID=48850 RepID=UPI0040545DD7